MKAIKTDNAPATIGPYSQAIETGGLVFASGQLPINPSTGAFPEGIKEQTRQCLTNAKAILEAAGLSMKNVNEVYAEFFEEPFPARSAFAVKAVPKGALVEIECIAEKK